MKKTALLLCALLFSAAIYAQLGKRSDLSPFIVEIETTTTNNIVLKCTKGCAWETLTFASNTNDAKSIDEYGMTTPENTNSSVDPRLSNFLFTISKQDNKVYLKGLEGTAWKTLSFNIKPNLVQAFDEMGMSE